MCFCIRLEGEGEGEGGGGEEGGNIRLPKQTGKVVVTFST